ncbi:vegetative cell wall protein gp1-like isoform X2 [Sander lucioperca]|uniref:vegetative cell wall protein gp1-like isoform X2 n=1 Tax=Sander lucioperca TaxID=283035 RepID=UPI001653686E|nr:vegetative cell wall protein gp1-like isoform X2 [Sander lucioperca]
MCNARRNDHICCVPTVCRDKRILNISSAYGLFVSANKEETAMAILRTTLCAFLMVTLALTKPICMSEGEDSSKSSDSSETNSSEETAAHVEPSQEPVQPMSTEADVPTATEGAAVLLPSAEAGPSPATLETSAPPYPEDPQTSTDADASQLIPDDPSQTALGVDISQDMPNSDPAQDSINADTVHGLPDPEVSLVVSGTNQPPFTATTYQRFPQGATPPSPPNVINPTPPPFSAGPPLTIPVDSTLTSAPVCFTFQFSTPEPKPPRGDSI